jgi:tetratricopeptide (TPR) repeat protein
MELDDILYEQILELCDKGDKCLENEEFENAIKFFEKALDLIPNPKIDWEASTWVYSALGDTYFILKEYDKVKDYFYDALNCPNGIANPFILLRLGECLFELNDITLAKEYFIKAYMFEGYKIFKDEDEKYFNLIKETVS